MTFFIRLQSIADFRKYTALFDHFIFQGYVKGDSFQTDAYDILTLFSFCPSNNLQLVLENYNPTDTTAIEEYLRNSGLLAKSDT